MANTYATMQARIADELDRADLTSEIQNAIQDAIGLFERKKFYFQNAPVAFTFSTVAHQEYYTGTDSSLIPLIAQAMHLTGTFFGWRRQLRKRPWAYIDSISWLSTSYAQPVDWAYYGEQVRLYPIPDNAYVLNMDAVVRPARPSAATDAGPWMNDAEALVRTEAKMRLIKEVIRGTDMADELALLQTQWNMEYAAVTGETTTREATGRLEPSEF